MLKSCSIKELDRLEHFLACKAYNTDKSIVLLFNLLKDIIKKELNFDVTAAIKVYNKLFNSKIHSSLNAKQKQSLNAKLTELTRLIEKFLTIESLEENTAYKIDLLNQNLLSKSQHLLYQRHYKKQHKKSEDSIFKNLDYYQQARIRELRKLDYLYQTGEIYKYDNLEKLNEFTDLEYLLQKLSLLTTMVSLEQVMHREYSKTSFDILDELLKLEKYNQIPEIIINKANIDLITNKSEENYNYLLILLDKYASKISSKDLNSYYISATNYCTRQIKKGNFKYKQLYELYKTLHEKNILLENDVMPITKLKNIIAVACRESAFEWANTVLENYINKVQKNVRNAVYRYNLGVIAFYQKEFNTAVNHFIYANDINLSYDVNNRIMLLKSHYEIDSEYDERTLQIYRSTEKYFVSNKMLRKYDIAANKNFIRSLINLYKIKHNSTKMTIESLTDKIKKQELNSDRKWLNDKIKELT